jgi:hypothetical protein
MIREHSYADELFNTYKILPCVQSLYYVVIGQVAITSDEVPTTSTDKQYWY